MYEAYFGMDLNVSEPFSFAYSATNVSIEHCKARCAEIDCIDFLYDFQELGCYVNSPGNTLPLAYPGHFIYYYRFQQQVQGKRNLWRAINTLSLAKQTHTKQNDEETAASVGSERSLACYKHTLTGKTNTHKTE
jgi:hypothetical protein